MDSKNAAPTLTKFICATYDEVARWQKVFTEGFDNFGKINEHEMENTCELLVYKACFFDVALITFKIHSLLD